MATKHLKTKLFIVGLVAAQVFFMVQGFMTTSNQIILTNAQSGATNNLVKPQTVIEGVMESRKEYAKRIVSERVVIFFGQEHVNSMFELIKRESNFNPDAQNPYSTAYGMFQFLNSTWKTVNCVKTSDIIEQTECGMKYVEKRYGNPTKAFEFRIQKGWY